MCVCVYVQGAATADGRAMAGMGVHPRLAAMVQRSARINAIDLACLIASLLSEKDIVLRGRAGPRRPTANITLRYVSTPPLKHTRHNLNP
jgi:HrpA-like RNA helicase